MEGGSTRGSGRSIKCKRTFIHKRLADEAKREKRDRKGGSKNKQGLFTIDISPSFFPLFFLLGRQQSKNGTSPSSSSSSSSFWGGFVSLTYIVAGRAFRSALTCRSLSQERRRDGRRDGRKSAAAIPKEGSLTLEMYFHNLE